ncbi:T9SS sorting signal type C domain-containing protein [Flavobacterium sp. LB1P62]|uniref:T9SS sorting signal type C domain-containing protein n=1 Tax=Flavobacterium sp. LB1P62 TaxID=3401715 RepID=UPI003AAD004A
MIKKILLAKFNVIIFLLFAFSVKTNGQTSTSGGAYIWSTATSWTPTVVPADAINVIVNNPLTLDQNLTIGTGNYTFNQDVTDQPGGSNYNLTNLNASGSLTIASGTTTIGGVTNIGGNATFTLTVKSGATLIIGTSGSTSNNFLIGNKASITIEQGATFIVYGNIVNSNSTGAFIVNGLLQVYGDYITDNGNIDISGTTGQFYTTGAMTTQGSSSQIYGSSNNCISNCSGTSLGCGTSNPDNAYTAKIAPQSQTVCSGGTITTMTFTTDAPSPTYQWEYCLTAGGTYSTILGQTSSSYAPSSLTVTTWYRVKYTSSASGCGTKYSAPIPVYVSASTYTQSTAGQTLCGGVFGPISVSAYGSSLTYQWYSNIGASNSGGSLISGATSNSYTPSSTTGGTQYYYCVINSSCVVPVKTAVSGAFTVNLNSAVATSSSPVLCVNTLMTNITHTTTGATGIGTGTGLPMGLSASWSSNTITISGTPTVTGAFNYSIPLTGGCGTVSATGIITVNGNNTVGVASSAPTLCINTALTNITHATTGATGIGTATFPAGVTAAWASNTITISGTPTTSGSFNYSIPLTGGCGNVNATGTITVTANKTVGIASSTPTLCINSTLTNITHTTTGTTGIGTAIGLPAGVTVAWVSNTITISGTPSASGSFSYSIPLTGGCGAVNATGTITVNPNVNIASVTGISSLCIGGTATYTANTIVLSGGTGAWNSSNSAVATVNASGLVTGVSAGACAIIYTITGGCGGAIEAQQSVTVNAPSAPVFTQTDITQPNCSTSTGSVVLSGLPAGNWTINPGAISGSTTTTTITGLSPSTTNNFTVTTANGCISPASADVVMNLASVTSTWNGSSWSPSAPTSADKIIFNGNFSSTADLVGCSCQVNSGIIVVNSGHTLTLTNEVTVSGGSLTFENNSSLLQINGNANTGNITYKRINTTIRETDYTYWSSPVTAQTLKNLSPKTPSNFFYSFNAAADDWNQESSANVMSIGIGYIIRGPHYPSTPPPGFYEAPFQGVPNNGIVSVPIPFPGKETSNLIGNPYPSALNADLFLTTNSSVLDGTLYFWTHNTAIQLATNITNASAGSGAYAYTSDDYATYNLTGGVSTMIGNKVGGVEQISNKPAGKITSGQAFFATGIAAGNVVFNNSMRVSGGVLGVNNSQFFKFSDSKQKPVSLAEKNRVWLNLTNTQGAFKQMLVGYIPDATNGYDNAFDGESFDGNQFIDFYSINENKNLAIQGRTLPFDENDQVPLGYSSTIKGVFSITIDEVDGLLASQDVFIEDKNTNSVKNLKEGAYSFATETGVFNDRFVLRYVNTNKTLGNSDFEISDNTVLVSNKNKQIKINSSAETMNNIQVYNLLGKSLYQKTNVDANELVISNLGINHQVLLVKIILQNGKTITKKIVY